MNKAIDNYSTGKQIEVTAWKGQSVSASSGRFVCPECLEYVALDIRGHFRHQNKTPQSIECEKRVNTPSRSSYERMGLPLFLGNEMGTFRLYIGFPSLPENDLLHAEASQAYLLVQTSTQKTKKYYISRERFSTGQVTKLQLNALPSNRGRYLISYFNTPYSIKRKWTQNSDIWGDVQFFKCEDLYSRKVRPLGNIVVDTDYYMIGDNWWLNRYLYFVKCSSVGFLEIGKQKISVSKVSVSYSKAKTGDFQALGRLLMSRYHLNLLIGDSEMVPFWPPCIVDENYMIYPASVKAAVLAIDSPNKNPVVYKYQNFSYQETIVNRDAIPFFETSVSEEETPYSIDKAFNGNIQYIRRQCLHSYRDVCTAYIADESGNVIIRTGSPSEELSVKALARKAYYVRSNCKSTVYHLKANGVEHVYKIDSEQGIAINDISWNDAIRVVSAIGRILLTFTFQKPVSETASLDESIIKRLEACNGPMIIIDPYARALIRHAMKEPIIKPFLKRCISRNSISVQALKILKEAYGGL